MDDVTVISDDGSPHGPKCFVLWNPPLMNPAKKAGKRRSTALTTGLGGVGQLAGVSGSDGKEGGTRITRYDD